MLFGVHACNTRQLQACSDQTRCSHVDCQEEVMLRMACAVKQTARFWSLKTMIKYCIKVFETCFVSSFKSTARVNIFRSKYWCSLFNDQLKNTRTPTQSRGRTGRPPGRGRQKRARKYSDDDDLSDDDDNYVPRVSKRRAAVAAVSRMKQSSDYDDSDEEPPMKRTIKASPRGNATRGRGRPKRRIINDTQDSDDDSVDDRQSPKKAKRPCQYGKQCYRSVVNDFCLTEFLSRQ